MQKSILTFVCVLLASCGGASEPADSEATGTTETAGSEEEATQLSFEEMSHEQRGEYMASVVVPRMRAMFQEYDAEEFASFGCRTCHGENAREVGFHMPNTLHPLDPAQLPALFESQDPEAQRLAQFMGGQVMPTMAELLGRQPYDPETQEGFGCFGCHATAGQE